MSESKVLFNLDLSSSYRWKFVSPTQTAIASIPYVQELGDFPAGRNYFTRRSNLPSYLLKICLGGSGFLEYKGHTYKVTEGDMFWIDCENYQNYYTDPETGNWHLLWVHFYGESCKQYYNIFLMQNNGVPVANSGDNSLIKPLIERLFSVYSHESTGLNEDLHASGILTQIMVQAIFASVGTPGYDTMSNQHVAKTIDYINNNYKEQLTLDVLAANVNLNKYYLQKLFRKNMGISPNEYLIRTRIHHAKELLSITDYPISTIASEVGIDNIGHFINQFKTIELMTPRMYRKFWRMS